VREMWFVCMCARGCGCLCDDVLFGCGAFSLVGMKLCTTNAHLCEHEQSSILRACRLRVCGVFSP